MLAAARATEDPEIVSGLTEIAAPGELAVALPWAVRHRQTLRGMSATTFMRRRSVSVVDYCCTGAPETRRSSSGTKGFSLSYVRTGSSGMAMWPIVDGEFRELDLKEVI